jgi:hypothetical protein
MNNSIDIGLAALLVAIGTVILFYGPRIAKWVDRKMAAMFKSAPLPNQPVHNKNQDENLKEYYNSGMYKWYVRPSLIIARIMGLIFIIIGVYVIIMLVFYP